MNAIDTNVLVYRFDRSEPTKRLVAKQLMHQLQSDGETVLMWQVVAEFHRKLSAWRQQGMLKPNDVVRISVVVRRLFPIILPAIASIDRAIRYAETYGLSHWDSMLVAACAEASASILYTEDMGAPRKIDQVQLINPFAGP
jgi:predicted nucleic acid-binding protein